MKKQFVLLAWLFTAVLAIQKSFAQSPQVEQMPGYITGVAFRGNELWEVYFSTLVKRNLSTGAVEASFDAPTGIDGFYSISIDPKGDLWLALGNGIARFDGNSQWKIWNHQNTPALPSELVFRAVGVENTSGDVWVQGTTIQDRSSYFIYSAEAWKEDTALKGYYLSGFVNGPENQFIFCANDTLLLRQNNGWVGIPEPEEGTYNSLDNPIFDPEGHLWVTTGVSKTSLYRYDKLDTLPELMTAIKDFITDLAFDHSGAIFAATHQSGLTKWDGSDWAHSLPSLAGTTKQVTIWHLSTDSLGRLWIAQSLSVLTLWENGAPQKNFYYGIHSADMMGRDSQGNIWFFGYHPLLIRKNLSDGSIDYFEMFDFADDKFFLFSFDLQPGASNDLWFRSPPNDLFHFNGTAWSKFNSPPPLKNLNSFCADSKGRLYASGSIIPNQNSELEWYDPATNVWEKVDFSMFGNWTGQIGHLITDPSDNLWFGTTEGLGKRNISDGSVEIYPLPSNDNTWVSGIPDVQSGPGGMIYILDGLDNLWENDGHLHLFQFNTTTATMKDIIGSNPFLSKQIYVMTTGFLWHVDPQGRVWVSVSTQTDTGGPFRHWFWENDTWTEVFGLPDVGMADIASDGNGNIYLSFYYFLATFKHAPGRVEGTVRRDTDHDCLPGGPDMPLPNFVVVATDGQKQYLGFSQSDGAYRVFSGSDQVTVSAVPPNSLWKSCQIAQHVVLDPKQPTSLDLLLQADLECPHLTVDISTPRLRRCFNSTYTAKICNNGTATALEAYVDITLPDEMTLQTATLPYTTVGAQQYRFPLGDLEVGTCRIFQFVSYVHCENTAIGQTLCVTAHVYPDSICIETANPWKGATVLLSARCDGDSVRFELRNEGKSATSQPLEYQLIRNQTLVHTGVLDFLPGQRHIVSRPADGDTWRLSATQEPDHPFLPRTPSLAVEGCSTAPALAKHGFVNNLPNSSGSDFEDMDCQPIIDALDPNDKIAAPVGVGENTHFILPGTQIEYHIRFQNTGTDTAFTVVLRDTLDRWLNLASFEPGASSHPYHLDVSGNALAFVFDNILLPDSNVNRAGSQGFLNFRIRPRPNIPLGTVVTNTASIYFDFNPAVVTHTVWHLVDNDFQETVSTSSPKECPQASRMWIFPNPTQGSFWVKTPDMAGTLEVYDAQGRLQEKTSVQSDASPAQVSCADCPNGLYLLRFICENQAIALTGRVLVQGR